MGNCETCKHWERRGIKNDDVRRMCRKLTPPSVESYPDGVVCLSAFVEVIFACAPEFGCVYHEEVTHV